MRKLHLVSTPILVLLAFFLPVQRASGVEANPFYVAHVSAMAPLKQVNYDLRQPLPIIIERAGGYSGSHEDWMSAAGISPGDYTYVDYVVTHESGWRPDAVNPIGATGLCQSLPGIKMATAGADYLTNPVTQLKWCNGYAQDRYGGWANAAAYWRSHANW